MRKVFNFIGKLLYNNKGFILILAAIVIFRMYFISIDIVVGSSMEPTLYNDDVVILDTQIYKLTELDRFDIIVFDNDDTDADKFLVKRIIGMPGESVSIRDGQLYIDGQLIETEDYIADFNKITGDYNSGVIPENCYFVLGDNRTVSLDSRSSDVGFVEYESIYGKVVFRQRPISEMGFIK